MTPRTTLLGFAAVGGGLLLLAMSAVPVLAVVGGVLVALGGVILVAAGALGVRAKDPVRADAAGRATDAAEGAAMKTSGVQGQWQRTSAGL